MNRRDRVRSLPSISASSSEDSEEIIADDVSCQRFFADQDDEEEEAMSGQCTVSYEDDGPKSSCQDDDDSSSAQSSSASDAMPSLFSGQLLSGDEESAVIEAVSFVFDQNLDWDCICISSIHVHGEPVMR